MLGLYNQNPTSRLHTIYTVRVQAPVRYVRFSSCGRMEGPEASFSRAPLKLVEGIDDAHAIHIVQREHAADLLACHLVWAFECIHQLLCSLCLGIYWVIQPRHHLQSRLPPSLQAQCRMQ